MTPTEAESYKDRWDFAQDLEVAWVTVEDRWLSADELTEYLGVSRDTVYTWLSTKALPGHKVGRLWKFKREEIDDWVRAGHANSAVRPRNKSSDDPQPARGKVQPRTRRRR